MISYFFLHVGNNGVEEVWWSSDATRPPVPGSNLGPGPPHSVV